MSKKNQVIELNQEVRAVKDFPGLAAAKAELEAYNPSNMEEALQPLALRSFVGCTAFKAAVKKSYAFVKKHSDGTSFTTNGLTVTPSYHKVTESVLEDNKHTKKLLEELEEVEALIMKKQEACAKKVKPLQAQADGIKAALLAYTTVTEKKGKLKSISVK